MIGEQTEVLKISCTTLYLDRVFIFHGSEDQTVQPTASQKIWEFYDYFIPSNGQKMFMNNIEASHAVVSDHSGSPCGINDDSGLYIQNCGYNSVFEMLNFLLGGDLNPPNPPGTMDGTLTEFDQNEFFTGMQPSTCITILLKTDVRVSGGANSASMDNTGYVYVPPACESGNTVCR